MPRHNTESGLTTKQERFVEEYIVDWNATRAATAAGYSEKTAYRSGSDLLQNPRVQEALAAALKAQQKRTQITADRVLQEVARVAFFDIRKIFNEDGTLKRVHELDDDTAAAIAAVDALEVGGDGKLMIAKKVKAVDKGGALDKLMRHFGMYAADKVEHTGKDGAPLFQNMSDAELDARIARLQREHGETG